MASNEAQIEAVMEERAAAMAARDIERLMAVYTTDVVYFDLVPPLSYSGAAALRARFLDWFGRWESPIGQRVDHLQIISGVDVATAFMLIEASGTLKGGRDVKYWVRTTNGLRRIAGTWRIAHEHVSLPVDMATRSAVMDLAPWKGIDGCDSIDKQINSTRSGMRGGWIIQELAPRVARL